MAEWLAVAPAEELPEGSARTVDIDDETTVVVVHCPDGFYAVEDLCSHDYSPLDGGEIVDCQIVCPRHGAHFDLRTGEALTPPAFEPIATFPVRVHEGMVEVRDARSEDD